MRFSFALTLLMACSSGGGNSPDDLYPSTCEEACQNDIDCGTLAASELDDCVVDCRVEPWPRNYRHCVATTCGLTEGECEQFGVLTCEEACDNEVQCGSLPASDRDPCVADCRGEPWEGNYVDCRATTCGLGEADCESFGG